MLRTSMGLPSFVASSRKNGDLPKMAQSTRQTCGNSTKNLVNAWFRNVLRKSSSATGVISFKTCQNCFMFTNFFHQVLSELRGWSESDVKFQVAMVTSSITHHPVIQPGETRWNPVKPGESRWISYYPLIKIHDCPSHISTHVPKKQCHFNHPVDWEWFIPPMVIWGMVYSCFTHMKWKIMAILLLSFYHYPYLMIIQWLFHDFSHSYSWIRPYLVAHPTNRKWVKQPWWFQWDKWGQVVHKHNWGELTHLLSDFSWL